MIKNTIGASLLALGLIGATSSQALVVIENFEAPGNGELSGVSTFTHPGYVYINAPFSPAQNAPNSLWAEGTLAETTSSSGVHSLWSPNVTAFNGNMFLAVNGATTPGAIVFQKAGIAVTGGLNYFFDANLTALFPGVNAGSTADLQFTVQYFAAGNVPSGAAIVGGVFTPNEVGTQTPTTVGEKTPPKKAAPVATLEPSKYCTVNWRSAVAPEFTPGNRAVRFASKK